MEADKTGISEDWLSLWLGLFIFVLSLFVFGGADILGWGISNSVWTDVTKSMSPVSKSYAPLKGEITRLDGQKVTLKKADGKEETITVADAPALKVGDWYEKPGVSGFLSLVLTYIFMLVVMTVGAAALRANIPKFIIGFTIVFWLSYLCWLLGHFAYIAATNAKKAGVPWSLRLTGEAGFIVALVAGLLVGNFFPKLAQTLKEAVRPELYIKTAIVLMGALLGVKAAESFGLATAVMFRGLCAIIEAYLIYWALVYFVSRRFFHFSKEWSACLASGISVCGVSAAIATGGAIKARPVVPAMIASLVVIFAVVELIILPGFATEILHNQPMVAGAWMGLAVKTDGAAVASGAITDALIRGRAAAEGINWQEGWMLMAATTTKLFIDMFIGIWAFVLAVIWTTVIDRKPGEKVAGASEIWNRFPKFVIGYFLTFLIMLGIGLAFPGLMKQATAATGEIDVFRVIFFVLTFLSIGLVSDFKQLWAEGIGKMAVVYLVCLFGFILWIGLAISFIFFHGLTPPVG